MAEVKGLAFRLTAAAISNSPSMRGRLFELRNPGNSTLTEQRESLAKRTAAVALDELEGGIIAVALPGPAPPPPPCFDALRLLAELCRSKGGFDMMRRRMPTMAHGLVGDGDFPGYAPSGVAVLIDVLNHAATACTSPCQPGDCCSNDDVAAQAWALLLEEVVSVFRLFLNHVQRQRQIEEAEGKGPMLSLLSLIEERRDTFRACCHTLLQHAEYPDPGRRVASGVRQDVELLLEELLYDEEEEEEQR